MSVFRSLGHWSDEKGSSLYCFSSVLVILWTSSRELEATTWMVAHNLDEEFVVTCLLWIVGYVRLEPGTKSASLETDVFSQQYALIVVHATVGLLLL